jgi:hypothetical protein
MILFILGIVIIAMIATLVLSTIGQDDYSNWGEEYMDEELEKLKSKLNQNKSQD